MLLAIGILREGLEAAIDRAKFKRSSRPSVMFGAYSQDLNRPRKTELRANQSRRQGQYLRLKTYFFRVGLAVKNQTAGRRSSAEDTSPAVGLKVWLWWWIFPVKGKRNVSTLLKTMSQHQSLQMHSPNANEPTTPRLCRPLA